MESKTIENLQKDANEQWQQYLYEKIAIYLFK